jgi:DNA-binding LacI/PurR family transcriptional regulator
MRSGAEVSVDSSMFFLGVIDGVQPVLEAAGLDLVALLYPSDGDPDLFLRRAVARRFMDALIVTGTRRGDPRVAFLNEKGIPFVTLGRTGDDPDHLWFDADVADMARQAVDRLVAKGHRRFAILVSDDGENFYEMFVRSFRQRVAEHGLDPGAVLVMGGHPSEVTGHALTLAMLAEDRDLTAIVAPHEAMTFGAHAALSQIGDGLQRVALIGRDSPRTRILQPSITRFELPLKEIGTEMARSIVARLSRQEPPAKAGIRQMWRATLVEGESDTP